MPSKFCQVLCLFYFFFIYYICYLALARTTGCRDDSTWLHDEMLPRGEGEGGDEEDNWTVWPLGQATGSWWLVQVVLAPSLPIIVFPAVLFRKTPLEFLVNLWASLNFCWLKYVKILGDYKVSLFYKSCNKKAIFLHLDHVIRMPIYRIPWLVLWGRHCCSWGRQRTRWHGGY